MRKQGLCHHLCDVLGLMSINDLEEHGSGSDGFGVKNYDRPLRDLGRGVQTTFNGNASAMALAGSLPKGLAACANGYFRVDYCRQPGLTRP